MYSSQWWLVKLYKLWTMFCNVCDLCLRFLKLKYFLDVVMVHKYVHVTVIVLYHNLEVIENVWLIFVLYLKYFVRSTMCRWYATNTNLFIEHQLSKYANFTENLILLHNEYYSWWRLVNLGSISMFINLWNWL